jgi:hypothetical protein
VTPSGETTEPAFATWLAEIWAEAEDAAKRQDARWYVCDDGHVEQAQEQWADGTDRLPNHHNTWLPIYDPAEALARVVAEREILATHYPESGACGECGDPLEYTVAWPCPTVRLIATSYANRPDFLEEWRA